MAAPQHDFEMIANLVTPFALDGSLDETALRAQLQRMVDAGVGIFANSPGSGACHSVTMEEYGRICEISMEVAGGNTPVYTMTPELHDIDLMIEFAQTAAKAGVDEVQLFQVMGGHGMKATREEQLIYWRRVLTAINSPVSISVHSSAGYAAPPELLAQLCGEFAQIRAVLSYGNPAGYVIAVRDALPDNVKIGGHLLNPGIAGLAIGMTVLTGAEPNIIPKTSRALIDCYAAGDVAGTAQAVTRIQRLQDALKPWYPPNSRNLFLAMRVLGLPGGDGAVRPPLVMPAESEFAKCAAALDSLGVRDWE